MMTVINVAVPLEEQVRFNKSTKGVSKHLVFTKSSLDLMIYGFDFQSPSGLWTAEYIKQCKEDAKGLVPMIPNAFLAQHLGVGDVEVPGPSPIPANAVSTGHMAAGVEANLSAPASTTPGTFTNITES